MFPHDLPTLRKPVGPIAGLTAFLGGIRFVLGTPSVWAYAAVPFAVCLVLWCGFAGVGIWAVNHYGDRWLGEQGAGLAKAAVTTLEFLLYAAAFVLAALPALMLAQPLSGFALEAIVQAQVRALTGRTWTPPNWFRALFNNLKVLVVSLLAAVVLLGGLLLVTAVFPPLAVVTVPLKVLIAGWLLAWDVFDYPLGLVGMGMRKRLKWIAPRLLAFSAFGVAWLMLLVVPGVVLLILPMAVAGATRLVVEPGRSVR